MTTSASLTASINALSNAFCKSVSVNSDACPLELSASFHPGTSINFAPKLSVSCFAANLTSIACIAPPSLLAVAIAWSPATAAP